MEINQDKGSSQERDQRTVETNSAISIALEALARRLSREGVTPSETDVTQVMSAAKKLFRR
jgi:hypothetical protein